MRLGGTMQKVKSYPIKYVLKLNPSRTQAYLSNGSIVPIIAWWDEEADELELGVDDALQEVVVVTCGSEEEGFFSVYVEDYELPVLH